MARIIKYYVENGLTVIEDGNDSEFIRPSFNYNSVNDTVTIINLDNQAQDWSAESSVFRKKDGSSIGSTKSEIVTYLSENTIFSKSEEIPDTSWGTIIGTLSDQTDLQSSLDAKQDELVSGTNIKTINGSSVLGSGDINITSANPTSGIVPVNENGIFVDSVIAESNGKIGIGTTNPGEILTLSGTGPVRQKIISTDNQGARLDLQSSGGSRYSLQSLANGDFMLFDEASGHIAQRYFNGASGAWAFYTAGTEKMRINSLGNVGIGTTAPSQKLQVNGNIRVGNTGDSIFANKFIALGSGDVEVRSNPGSNLLLNATAGDNVGIGTTNPSQELHVNGNILADGLGIGNNVIYSNSINLNNAGSLRIGNAEFISKISNDMSIFQSKMVVTSAGNVGIGTTNPSTALDVVGAITVNDGNNNTKVGTNSGLNYTGINQSAFGYNAGLNSSGDNQTVVGYQAGQSNTATSQSAFGRDSGRINTGINQSAFGRESGSNNSGDNQSVLGSLAGFSNTGDNQTAVGRESGRDNTGGSQSAFGYAAGLSNTGGSQSAFGVSAGRSNTGTNQSAFGRDSGYLNTGDNQSAFGYFAGRNNTGTNQSAFGRSAGRSNTGDNNSNFGYNAGYYLSDSTTVNTASSNSVFLGAFTKALSASQTNQIVIGYNATGVGANSVVLGNDSIATTALKGNVGIGTSSPSVKLDVNGGDIRITDSFPALYLNGTTSTKEWSLINVSDGALSIRVDDSEKVSIEANGNVGIGTASPSEKLEVDGNISVLGSFGRQSIYGPSSIKIGGGTASGDRFMDYVMDGNQQWRTGVADADLNKFGIAYKNNGTPTLGVDNILTLKTSGNVGIGTANPSAKLHLSRTAAGGTTLLLIENPDATNQGTAAQLQLKTGLNNATIRAVSGSGGAGYLQFYNENSERMRIDANGNVGIGTTNPVRELDIEGSINLKDSSFSNTRGIYGQGGSMLTFDASNFNLTFGGDNIVANSFSGIMDFKANGFSSFMTHDSGSTKTTFSYDGSEKMCIVGDTGNVGIGITSPTEKLDVDGTVKAQGYKSADGSAGITQTVNTGGGNTLVIKNGIITAII